MSKFDWTLDTFEIEVKYNQHLHPEWRYGQALFNTLYTFDPELANMIRTTSADPFYAQHRADKRVALFYQELFG